ncbi:MAG: response regulator [Methanomassiliicoccales archaeon]
MPGEDGHKKILVIDDEEGIRGVISDLLAQHGYLVKTCSRGKEALDLLSREFHHLVILDVRLPDMTGIKVMNRMEEISPDTQVILVTAYASVNTAVEALKGRAFDYLSKPFKTEELLESIASALEYQGLKFQNQSMLRRLSFLNDLSSSMVRTLRPDAVLELVLDKTIEFFELDSGAIYTESRGQWVLRRSKGVSDLFRRDFGRIDKEHPIVRKALEHQLAVLGKGKFNSTGATWASVPFAFGDRILGIMVLAGKGTEHLEEEDRKILSTMGAQVGTVLNNVFMFEKTERTRGYLQNVLDNITDAIVTYDLKGNIKSWNSAAERIFGYHREESVGRRMLTVPRERMGEVKGILEEVRNGGRVEDFETVRERKDGSLVDVSVSYSPLHDPGGRLIGFSAILRDLTSQREAEWQRTRSGVLEAQGKIRDVLIDVIPLLLRKGIPQEDKNEFVLTLSRKLEEALYDDYVEGEVDQEGIADSIARVFNDMGGEFDYLVEDNLIRIVGNRCPWGNQNRKNPVICMLTKGICARFAKRALGDIQVSLDKTLANGDDRCQVTVTVK